MAKRQREEEHETQRIPSTPEKTRTRTRKATSEDQPIIPSMTEEQTKAYMTFSEECKEVYEKFSKGKMDARILELKSTPALILVVRLMIMLHDLLKMYGVMQFNKHVSPTLYQHLDEIQDKTGVKLPLVRVLLDGIKATKMELLSGVTVHPLPDFKEPEYKIMAAKTPDPLNSDDEGFEPQDPAEGGRDESSQPPSHVGPGGPDFDDSVQPQSGTPVDPPVNPPDSVEEETLPEGSE